MVLHGRFTHVISEIVMVLGESNQRPPRGQLIDLPTAPRQTLLGEAVRRQYPPVARGFNLRTHFLLHPFNSTPSPSERLRVNTGPSSLSALRQRRQMSVGVEHIELMRNGSKEQKANDVQFKKKVSRQHTHELVIGTDQDPYNKEELVNTLRGRELGFFVIFYIVAVMAIVLMFEFFMPVLFNPDYPNS
ncbi:unnamed protein product [Caenorhabditis auriculariae]|uniref:Uncharacterized protein n=1 Tax=Caenorhabditis auriculariae TaxID=2777116 RepID=A0A8S1HA94_9PELO|nr:unnamed protein product [Caenorhabditis auriculariae]